MIRRIRYFAAQVGLGLGAVYAFFMVPSIAELFAPTFLILLRQSLALGFALCLLLNPKALIEIGETFAPKLITFFQIFFTNNKDKRDE